MLITNRLEFDHMLRSISASDVLVVDTEADGLHLRHDNRTIGISIYVPSTSESFYFTWAHGTKQVNSDYSSFSRWSNDKKRAYAYHVYKENFLKDVLKENSPESWLSDLRDVWTPDKLYIGHNIQYDLTAFRLLGFPTPTKIADTMAMLSVVNSDWRGNALEGIFPMFPMPDGTKEKGSRGLKWQARLWNLVDASQGIDELTQAVQQLDTNLKVLGGERATLGITNDSKAQEYLWMLKPSEVALYAEDDVRLTYLLYEKILRFSESWGDQHLHSLYNDITLSVWRMQDQGFRLDLEQANRVIEEGERNLSDLESRIVVETGGMVHSANSPAQVTAYLRSLGHNVESSSKDVLKKIEGVPVLRLIEEVRHEKKLLSTYVKAWRDNAVRGHVHPELNVGGTATGRLSSSSDMFGNFQNVPRTTAKGNINPKMLLYPPEGNIIIDLDYQALEMRVGAWVAETLIGKEKSLVLTDLIENDTDMHEYTMRVSGIYQMLLNGRTEEEYLRDEGYDLSKISDPVAFFFKLARQFAKTTNFAAIYGAGTAGIQKAVGCTKSQAETLLKGYHMAYPAVKPAMEKLERLAMTPTPLPTHVDANRIRALVLDREPKPYTEYYDLVESSSTKTGQYVVYPIKEVGLRRKYGFYPVTQESENGSKWSPLKKAARGAFNSVVQGTGGLLVLNSLLKAEREFGTASYTIEENGDRIYDYSTGLIVPHLTVHDSDVISLRPQDLRIVPEIVRLMTDYPIRPKLGVEVSAARINGSWGETEKVKDLDRWIASEGREGFQSLTGRNK